MSNTTYIEEVLKEFDELAEYSNNATLGVYGSPATERQKDVLYKFRRLFESKLTQAIRDTEVKTIEMIQTSKGSLPFTFPARMEKVMVAIYGSTNLNQRDSDQAKRTAWKNVYDLIYAQITFIKTEQTSLEQLMLGFSPIYKMFEDGGLQIGQGDNY